MFSIIFISKQKTKNKYRRMSAIVTTSASNKHTNSPGRLLNRMKYDMLISTR